MGAVLLIWDPATYTQSVKAQVWPNPWPTAGWLCNGIWTCTACDPCDRCDLTLGMLTNYCECINGSHGCDRQNGVKYCVGGGAFNEFCTNNQHNCGNTFKKGCDEISDWVEVVPGGGVWIWMVVSCDNLGCYNSGSVSSLCSSCDTFP